KRIAIFASGGGSNALKFLEYFENVDDIDITLIVSNRRDAGVLDHARAYDVPTLCINRGYFQKSEHILEVLKKEKIDMIVLAGFLWLVPSYLVKAYPQRIVNIHPALLPKYGGKGMYGHHVHEAVKKAGDKKSGMTIHFVNEKFDDGNHIFQATCALNNSDSPKEIASKVLKLEHKHYAEQVHKLLV
ncbi:UNVERIFIED_CONTAM: hypothetical protein GTU68_038798, partial [Idotea baltica]|nr:hypothetical protein [Idotea baltica]